MTESCGPVMPASVMNAVPFGSTVASDVWTCVCVPTTAVTRPSSQRPSRSLLARRLRVDVDEHHRRLLPRLLHELVDHLEHRRRRVQEERAENVDHGEAGAVRGGDDHEPASRSRTRRVRRTDDAIGCLEVRADLGPPKRVVAERDRIDAHAEELVGEARRDPDAVRGVLAVDHARVDLVLAPNRLQALLERPPDPGLRRRRR